MTKFSVIKVISIIIFLWDNALFVIANNDKTTIKVNPDCDTNCTDKIWVVHGTSNSGDNITHYLWGTVGAPVLVIASTDLPTNHIIFDWKRLQDKENNSGSIYFYAQPNDIYVVSFPNLILFNDTEDTGKFDEDTDEHIVVPMSEFDWTNTSQIENEIILVTKSFRGEPLGDNSNITLKLTVYNENGRSSVLPKLLTTPESSQFELSLQNLTINFSDKDDNTTLKYDRKTTKPISGFIQPRFAVEIVMFTDEENSEFKFGSKKTLDDEYSPGVFHLDQITSTKGRSSTGNGGYLQWRPIGYCSKKRHMDNSTFPNMALLKPGPSNTSLVLEKSLVNALFGDGVGNLISAHTVVSFGQPKDGFYTNTEFVMWVVSMGYGTPPEETFSTLIIIVMSLGVGIPTLLFLVGGVAIYIKKRRHNSSRELLVN